ALGILRSIQNVAERTMILDASRSDLVTGGTYTTDSINDLMNFNKPADGSSVWCNVADYYHIVNSCNFYLANVDTTITENNVKIMQREWAQVQAMRAWAYIQLVRNYGEVPFVTTPVGSTDEAEAAMNTAGKVNASNIASLLVESGLERAYQVQRLMGIPNYGTFNNGYITFSSTKNFFPVDIVLADAYLMGDDYANAAQYYYNYFTYTYNGDMLFNNRHYSADYNSMGKDEKMYVSSGNLLDVFSSNSSLTDYVTAATSASTNAKGTVLTQVQNMCGFKTTVSGTSIVVTPNEQYMQMMPSEQYVSINKAQRYNKFEQDGELAKMEEAEGGDGRLLAYAPNENLKSGLQARLINKFAPNFMTGLSENMGFGGNFIFSHSMNYQIPLYRIPVVLLRYAEAVNRLGFPQLAFGILKDGISYETLPSYGTHDLVREVTKYVRLMDVDGETLLRVDTVPGVMVGVADTQGATAGVIYDSDSTTVVYDNGEGSVRYIGDFIPAEPSIYFPGLSLADIPEDVQATWYNVDYLLKPTAFNGGMYYVSLDEAKAMTGYPFLDFTGSKWQMGQDLRENNYSFGVHSRGCGDTGGIYDTVYTYARQVAEKIAEEYARTNNLSYADQQAYAKTLYNGDELLVTDKEAIQNAVENLIVDELALETAFEGNRYGDLIRIAEHKNKAGFNGTDWFAWKIARRNKSVTDPAADVDAGLKAKLLDKTNWYLSLPK
ncbi:MAG: hypothetical protein ACI4TS_04670, partial [Bacteroidaceae bacterium]